MKCDPELSDAIILDPGDYWRIKAKFAQVQQHRAELRALVLERQSAIDALARDGQADLDTLAKQYGFDPSASWTWDDTTTSIRPPPEATP
jgi:hypothetical protein